MIIKGGTVITPFEKLESTDVVIEDSRIKSIVKDYKTLSTDKVIDAHKLYVCPGFVDIHTHGGGGGDFMDGSAESFDKALRFHAQNGTTSVVATSVTAPVDDIVSMLNMVHEYKNKSDLPCRILGAHIEGPYISLKNKGAQHEKYLRIPSRDSYDFILDNKDIITQVTVSAELDGMGKMVKDLVDAGIVVSCGHDDGRKSDIMPLIELGITKCTHWYCAMSAAAVINGVRSVGMMEIGLIDDRLTLELIADNHHIVPELAKLAYKCKGAEKLCLVSDSLRVAGLPADGTVYSLGSSSDKTAQKIVVSDGVAKLADGSKFAGSVQLLNRMVRNLVFDCGISIQDAVRMASYTPASVIKAESEIGSVSVGKKADLCLMDREMNVVMTISDGKIIA